jgi:hypothetical protein
MGFNHCHIPNISAVMWELETHGIEKFVKLYTTYDSYGGDSEAIQFIEQTLKQYYEQATTIN